MVAGRPHDEPSALSLVAGSVRPPVHALFPAVVPGPPYCEHPTPPGRLGSRGIEVPKRSNAPRHRVLAGQIAGKP